MPTPTPLIGKGSKVTVDVDSVRDRLPNSLLNSLSVDPVGTVIDYKMTDATGIGFILKLSDGSINWFFEDELINLGSDLGTISGEQGKFRRKEIDPSEFTFYKNKNSEKIYKVSSIPRNGLYVLFNPIYFLKWLFYSLKDIF